MDLDWDKVSYVIRSRYRKKVVLGLEGPKTPTQLSKELGTQRTHVSRALLELMRDGIVECLTPDQKRGRIYRRTREGDKIAEHLKEKD